MSKFHCYLCASDEGILLDIFGDGGKIFRENIETCLSVKIKQSDAPSTKICHKCAWELDCCGKFVRKYKQSRIIKESKTSAKLANCILCCEAGNKNHILELRKGNALNNFQRKICKLFNENFLKGKLENLSVCLDCRYNVDVLFDLKNIYKTTLEKFTSILENGVKISDLPRTRTRIVSRKTTEILLARLNSDFSYDSDTNTSSAMSSKRKRGEKGRKENVNEETKRFRTCEECNTYVEHGIDMYRYHRTGMTVCRECWLTMDPEKMSNGKRTRLTKTRNSTKLCAVFLKDVLSNPSRHKNVYKTEKDKDGNTTYLITDESSENDERGKTRPMRLRAQSNMTSIVETKTPEKRHATEINETEPAKKMKGKRTSSNEPELSNLRARARNGISVSEMATTMTTRTRRSSVQSTSSVKSISQESEPSTRKTPKKIGGPAKTGKIVSPSEKSTNFDIVTRKKTRTRSSSFTSQETISSSNRLAMLSENKRQINETTIPEVETTGPRRILPMGAKSAKSDSELEKLYTCAVCRIGYKNKLIGMAHQLTHSKQPEVKLERVVVPTIVIEIPAQVSGASSTINESEQQSHDVSSTSDHKDEKPVNIPVTFAEESDRENLQLVRDKEDSPDEKLKEQFVKQVVDIFKDNDNSESEKMRPEAVGIVSVCEKNSKEEKMRPDVEEMSQEREDLNDERLKLKVTEVGEEEENLKEGEKIRPEVSEEKENLEEGEKIRSEVSEEKENLEEEEKIRPEDNEMSQENEDLNLRLTEVCREEVEMRSEVTKNGKVKDEVEEKKLRPEVTQVSGDEVNLVEEKLKPEVMEISREKENSEGENLTPEVQETGKEKDDSKDEKSKPEDEKMYSHEKDETMKTEKLPLPVAKSPKFDEKFDDKLTNDNNDVEEEAKEKTEKLLGDNCIVHETKTTKESARIDDNVVDMIDKNDETIDDENENKENDKVTKKTSDENENSTQNHEKEETLESKNVTETSGTEEDSEKSDPAPWKDMEKECENVNSAGTELKVEKNANLIKEITTDGETDFSAAIATNSKENSKIFVDSTTTSVDEKNYENCTNDEINAPTELKKDKMDDTPSGIETNEKITTEISNLMEIKETNIVENSESLSVTSDVVRQVFDLAIDEVKKRLEKEKSNDKNCPTVSETLENISREIQDGADITHLQIDNESANKQS